MSKRPTVSVKTRKTTNGAGGRLFVLDLAGGRVLSANPDGTDLKTHVTGDVGMMAAVLSQPKPPLFIPNCAVPAGISSISAAGRTDATGHEGCATFFS